MVTQVDAKIVMPGLDQGCVRGLHRGKVQHMDFNSEGAAPRCRAEDVDAEWWYDQDIERDENNPPPEHFNHLEKARWRRQQVEPTLAKQRENQLRAKFFCLECPLLMACREAGWQEGSHVWASLDGSERYRILKSGRVTEVIRPLETGSRATKDHEAVALFMGGMGFDEIAERLGIRAKRVQAILREALVSWRVEREEEEGWRSQRGLPSLQGMGREAYRNGLAAWSLSERESA